MAVFGALISGSFPAGMRQALLISVALLAASTVTYSPGRGTVLVPGRANMSDQVVSPATLTQPLSLGG